MSTQDVPGADEKNGDTLHAGCWAEHEDGSLIYVKGTEHGKVVYEMFDLSRVHDPVVYTDVMPEAGFKRTFSHPPTGKSKEKWTWHDKTPFDWDRVIRRTPVPRPEPATAEHLLSAAERVAQSLRLKGARLVTDRYRHMTEDTVSRARGIWDRIDGAVRNYLKG